jgi:hypothetical protein
VRRFGAALVILFASTDFGGQRPPRSKCYRQFKWLIVFNFNLRDFDITGSITTRVCRYRRMFARAYVTAAAGELIG